MEVEELEDFNERKRREKNEKFHIPYFTATAFLTVVFIIIASQMNASWWMYLIPLSLLIVVLYVYRNKI